MPSALLNRRPDGRRAEGGGLPRTPGGVRGYEEIDVLTDVCSPVGPPKSASWRTPDAIGISAGIGRTGVQTPGAIGVSA